MAIDKEVEPILIASVKNNRLLFSTTTFRDILSKVGSRPVSVVSISYPNGEEKDQVFNGILKFLKTLDVSNPRNDSQIWETKTNGEAKGIYLWPEPIIIRKSCQEVAVLLMELKGCFDPMTATRDDLMLFALNCILSSTFICGFENEFWSEIQDFLQLFGKYGCGGIGSDLSDSFLNLVLMVNNWKSTKRYPFGYHDSSTSPPNGGNYRKSILDSEMSDSKYLTEDQAFKNQNFVRSFHKIGFCLMPGNDSEMFDQNSNPFSFADLWQQITGRLFHPSNVSIKCLAHKKLNGHQLVKLFEQICALMTEANTQDITHEELMAQLRDVRALSVALTYYKSKMDKELLDKEFLKENYLKKWHNESRNNALKLFDTIRGMTDREEPARDGIYELFNNEVQNIWHFYEDLNRSKSELLSAPLVKDEDVNQLVEEILQKKKEFETKQTGLDTQISRLIGFSLETLSTAVRSTLTIK